MTSSQIGDKEEGMRKIRISQKESIPSNAKFMVSLDIILMILYFSALDVEMLITHKEIAGFKKIMKLTLQSHVILI